MPQLQLPLFPRGVTEITANLSFKREDERITYYHGTLPVFSHSADDLATFRMITSQFIEGGHVSQAQISRSFGIPLVTVKRSVKRYREEGARGFYVERKTRGAAVLTAPILIKVQQHLDDGLSVKEVAEHLQLKKDTLNKAVLAGRLHVAKKKTLAPR